MLFGIFNLMKKKNIFLYRSMSKYVNKYLFYRIYRESVLKSFILVINTSINHLDSSNNTIRNTCGKSLSLSRTCLGDRVMYSRLIPPVNNN